MGTFLSDSFLLRQGGRAITYVNQYWPFKGSYSFVSIVSKLRHMYLRQLVIVVTIMIVRPVMSADKVAKLPQEGVVDAAADGKDSESELLDKNMAKSVMERIDKLVKAGSINKNLGNEAMDYINQLIKKTRRDQDIIYSFVRTIDRNMENINDEKYRNKIKEITWELKKSSYSDYLHQNGNLSYQINTRLPLLVEDSLDLGTTNKQDNFKQELELFKDKYIDSKRFYAGIGLSYIPAKNNI